MVSEKQIAAVRKSLEDRAARLPASAFARRSLNRRTFVLGSLATGAMWTTDISAQTPSASPMASPMASPVGTVDLEANPFTLGIASGDPLSDSVVLWTRLAPAPFEPNGGMPGHSVEVAYEIATDEGMTDIVQQGTALAEAEWAHSVHLEADGLEPDRWYHYRFRIGEYDSPIGRTKTAPAGKADRLRFAFASCQRWDQGLYTAYRDLVEQDVDLVVHLGDYIYEMRMSGGTEFRDGDVPFVALGEVHTLENYRFRYALHKMDPHLQEAHRVAPWLVTWDDHEVHNNYFGGILRDIPASQALLERRADAYRAYYEHQPLRAASRPAGPDLHLYRRVRYGDLVEFNVLDTRQYRSPQVSPCPDDQRLENGGFCPDALDPERTMLGAEQKEWLLDGFGQATARWNVLAQQVPFARIDYDRGPDQSFGGPEMDKWDGYAAERDVIAGEMRAAATERDFNPVVITGDVHANYVWDLKRDWDDADTAPYGTEFVGTSISSNGDDPLKEDGGFSTSFGNFRGNRHNHFFDNHRGYVLCDLTPEQWQATYRGMSTVEEPDATASTLASFVVEHGRPGAQANDTGETAG